MLKLHHLRDFIAIAKAGSVRGAARELGQAQPAMARSLGDMERQLGVSLLQRHARGVTLTQTGERLLVRARNVLEELRRCEEEARSLNGEYEGSVSLALSSAAILGLLPASYREFRRKCPRVRLQLFEAVFPAAEPLMLDGRLDLFVGPRPDQQVNRGFNVELLFGNQRMVFVRRGHPMARTRTLAQLVDADWIYSGLRERAEEELEELFTDHKLPPPANRCRIDSLLCILTVLLHSDSVALLPQQWAHAAGIAELLQAMHLREVLRAPDIVLIQRAGVPLTPAAELFADLLRRAGTHETKARKK